MAERKRNTKTNSAKTEAAEEVKITDVEWMSDNRSTVKSAVLLKVYYKNVIV